MEPLWPRRTRDHRLCLSSGCLLKRATKGNYGKSHEMCHVIIARKTALCKALKALPAGLRKGRGPAGHGTLLRQAADRESTGKEGGRRGRSPAFRDVWSGALGVAGAVPDRAPASSP